MARAADDDCFVLMASLDLSAVFDLVNVELLITRLKVMGLPLDLTKLIKEWLTDRKSYVQVGDFCLALFDLDTGTIQGFVLGPVLYALFFSPLFDLTQLTNFADNNFCISWNRNLALLIADLELRLEMITKWVRDSGLVVNESKTEICLFHRNDQQNVTINVCGTPVTTKSFMNVLGVTFDCKLNWSIHITNCINKAKKITVCT